MMFIFTRKRAVISLGALVVFFLPIVAQLTGEPYLISLGSRILIYALAAVSLDLLLGYGAMISLGHAAFVGIGAYVIGIFTFTALILRLYSPHPFFFQEVKTDCSSCRWPYSQHLLRLLLSELSAFVPLECTSL